MQSEASEDAMASLNTSVGGGPGKPRRKRIGRRYQSGQPKLFGGSLEEYLEATNQEIPLIMKSSIRIINLYGEYDDFENSYWHLGKISPLS